jgi:hypothetical protein
VLFKNNAGGTRAQSTPFLGSRSGWAVAPGGLGLLALAMFLEGKQEVRGVSMQLHEVTEHHIDAGQIIIVLGTIQ